MLFLLFILLINVGCATTEVLSPQSSQIKEVLRKDIHKGNYYLVKKGDSFFSIARKLDTTVDDLIKENNLKKTSTIRPGDILFIPSTPRFREDKLLFLWPVKGKIINYFGEKISNKINKGIEIQTKDNETVKSSADGKVTFRDYLKGYGNTVIIKHSKNLSTVYTNLSDVSVKNGDYVKRGQAIGRVGKDLHTGIYLLHFEVRNIWRAENPLIYLRK